MGFHQDCVFPGLGMTRARNFRPESIMCLYSKPLTWVKMSVSCCGAFPLNNHLDMHLLNGSVFCIWSRASSLSAVRVLGVGLVTGETSGVISSGTMGLVAVESCLVWLLVLKAGPSVWVTMSMLIIDGVAGSHSTNLERQSAALFLAPEIHWNVML